MHIAPWMKLSISMSSGICSRISLISFKDNSLAETTRFAPSSCQKRYVPKFVLFAWVLIWISISGSTRFAMVKTPGSEIMRASGRIVFNSSKYSSTPARSSLCARIFAVIYTFTPWSWANLMPSMISSFVKFFALARRPNASPPRYTASAP